MKNKRGDSQFHYTIIFLVINLIFAGSIIYFVNNSSNGALIYEEIYSKKIALILDNSKPNTTISINIENLLKISRNNNIPDNSVVIINSQTGEIVVKTRDTGGYKTQFFSNYLVERRIEKNNLILEVRKNEKS